MKQKLLLLTIVSGFSYLAAAQNNVWYGKKAAVVITYDDAIDQQLDNAVPVLDSLGLKATFYLTAFSSSIQKRMDEWRKLATHGHELGNHTLYHPCNNGKGREWVSPDYDMTKYTVKRMVDEARMTNLFLHALDGKTQRTFAYTCGDMKIGDSLFMNAMKNDFVAARAVRPQMHHLDEIDLYDIDCYVVNGETAAQMMEWVNKARETHSLLVILFHGVGGGNSLDVAVKEHRKFLQLLKQQEKDLWIAPMVEVANFIKTKQNKG